MSKKEIKYTEFELIQIEKNYIKHTSLFIKDRTIFIVGRSEIHGKRIFFINDFYPRIFVESIEFGEYGDLYKEVMEEHSDKIHKVKTKNYKNLGGKKDLTKIYLYRTSDVQEIRDIFSKTYEANIKFTETLKRKKLIKGIFLVPEYIMEYKARHYVYRGIKMIKLKHKEIKGGELKF